MNRPNFLPVFTSKEEYCEKSSDQPIETFVPNQAISLSELVSRFEKGQRLNVHMNFKAGDNLEAITDEEALERIKVESMETDDFPPTDVHDIVDVQNALEAHEAHKADFAARQRKKKEEAKQAARKKAQQADDVPPTPPVDE